jgi:small subunit ribosomal protein S5
MRGVSRKIEPLEKEKKVVSKEALEEKVEEKVVEKVGEEVVKEAELPSEVGVKPEAVPEAPEVEVRPEEEKEEKRIKAVEAWRPRTRLGRMVKEGAIGMDEILQKGMRILEREIVEALLPNLEYELINIGQARGKFGGGKRRVWKQVQKKMGEGNVPKFAAMAVVGNRDGYLGVGYGKAKETLSAREKAIRNAELNIFKVVRGCGSFDCVCKESHSIPLAVEGKCAGTRVILKPAPRGTGLVADDEIKKIFRLAGIKDIYVQSFGQTRTKMNHVKAVVDALKKLNKLH